MAGLVIGYGKRTLNDCYYLYRRDTNEKGKLVHESVPSFYFYAKDYKDFSEQQLQQMGITLDIQQNLAIITNTGGSFAVNDKIVSIKDGSVWRISDIPAIPDDNRNKQYSMNPRKWSILYIVKFN